MKNAKNKLEKGMQTIWKYRLSLTDIQTIKVPSGSRVLSVQTQPDDDYPEHIVPCVWFLVPDTDVERQGEITFLTCGTGNPILEDNVIKEYGFLGTYQLYNGELVFHVFFRWENIT
jgi:hypothetical protein